MEWHMLFLNCCAALGLNIAVFLVIGKTSALTMNIAGVIKDWGLIFTSFLLYKSPIVSTQIEGYLVAFFGVMGYNYIKIKQRKDEKQIQTEEKTAQLKVDYSHHVAKLAEHIQNVNALAPASVSDGDVEEGLLNDDERVTSSLITVDNK